MKKLVIILTVCIGLKGYSQEVMLDWQELDGSTSFDVYLENQIYGYLGFDPEAMTSLVADGIQGSSSPSTTKVIIRKSIPSFDNPMVVVNGYLVEDRAILTLLKLEHVMKVSILKSSMPTLALYGTRGEHGVVLVEVHKRNWKRLKRK